MLGHVNLSARVREVLFLSNICDVELMFLVIIFVVPGLHGSFEILSRKR